MGRDHLDAETVTIELADGEAERLDALAATEYRGDRGAAVRALLDGWLAARRN